MKEGKKENETIQNNCRSKTSKRRDQNKMKNKVTWKNNQESIYFIDYASAVQIAHTIAFFYGDVYINKIKYERI